MGTLIDILLLIAIVYLNMRITNLYKLLTTTRASLRATQQELYKLRLHLGKAFESEVNDGR